MNRVKSKKASKKNDTQTETCRFVIKITRLSNDFIKNALLGINSEKTKGKRYYFFQTNAEVMIILEQKITSSY